MGHEPERRMKFTEMKPVFGIELDDSSQARPERAERDWIRWDPISVPWSD